MAGTSISEAFPVVPDSALAAILEEFELTPSSSAADLLRPGATASDVLNAIACYVMHDALRVRLDQTAPVLRHDGQLPLQLQAFSTRPANGLRRGGVTTWRQLVAMSPADLLRLPAVGRKSVTEIVAVALSRAAMHVQLNADGTAPPSPQAGIPADDGKELREPKLASSDGRDPGGSCGGAGLAGLEILARWAVCIGNAATIGAALDLAESQALPDDVAEAIESLRRTPLRLESRVKLRIAVAYDGLWKACGDERRREIFRRRIASQAPSLDELGAEMMLTRERVRQLQRAAEDSVLTALLRPESAEIRWRAAELRQQLGTAIAWSNTVVRDALDTARGGIGQDRATAETLMLWLAGSYRLDRQTGWLLAQAEYSHGEVGPRSGVGPPPRPSLLQAVTDDGVVNIEAVRAKAAAAGLVPAAIEDWIALCPFRDIDGTLVLWQGSVADKAAALLEILKRPATADELNGMIAEGHSVRSLRNRLLSDERFIRTDRFRVGLGRWGLEEYSGIVGEIEEEIARCGGEADVGDLMQTLTRRFDLRGGSVVSYTTVPRFVVNDGRIHVRRRDEPFVPARTLFDEARAFMLGENRCSYRVRVDEDVLRGSGRPLPQGVGGWLGVLPGVRREFRFPDDDVLLISWPDSALLGPALGSLRRQALARSAQPGDWLLLEFDRSSHEVEAMLFTQSELDAAKGWVRGTLLTGIDAGSRQEFEQLLVEAVGASSTADLRKRCRDRGDPELAELVRTQNSPDLDEALERLGKLL